MKHLLMGLIVAITSFNAAAIDTNHKGNGMQFDAVEINGLLLSKFKARATIGQMQNSGAYGEIRSTKGDRLVRASSDAAEVVELHQHINDNGVMRMREATEGFTIDPGQTMKMTPGGYHIMLFSVREPLRAGTMINLVLQFESGETAEIVIPVISVKEMHH